jgi:hypothetical protein
MEGLGEILVLSGSVEPEIVAQSEVMADDFQLDVGLYEQRVFFGFRGVVGVDV